MRELLVQSRIHPAFKNSNSLPSVMSLGKAPSSFRIHNHEKPIWHSNMHTPKPDLTRVHTTLVILNPSSTPSHIWRPQIPSLCYASSDVPPLDLICNYFSLKLYNRFILHRWNQWDENLAYHAQESCDFLPHSPVNIIMYSSTWKTSLMHVHVSLRLVFILLWSCRSQSPSVHSKSMSPMKTMVASLETNVK